MISGKLPNNTIWWLSTNGQKIWIESKDLEKEKFNEKGYSTTEDRIFSASREMSREIGELTTSRLESRKRKEAWVIKIDAMINVYPEIAEEIKRKDIEEKKKKKTSGVHKREIRKTYPVRTDSIIEEHKDVEEKDNKESEKIIDNKPARDFFSTDRPYVAWIKDEVDKSKIGELIIPFKDLKSKMGEEFEEMDNFRIFFGLNKVLPKVGLTLQSRIIKRENMAIISKS